jgi:hypothetical protein
MAGCGDWSASEPTEARRAPRASNDPIVTFDATAASGCGAQCAPGIAEAAQTSSGVPAWHGVAACGSRAIEVAGASLIRSNRYAPARKPKTHDRTSVQDDCSEGTGSQGSGDRRQNMGTGKRAPAASFGARAMAREELQSSQICRYCGEIFPYSSRGKGISN